MATNLLKPIIQIDTASLDRDAIDFVETGEAVLDLLQSRAAQVPDAFAPACVALIYIALPPSMMMRPSPPRPA